MMRYVDDADAGKDLGCPFRVRLLAVLNSIVYMLTSTEHVMQQLIHPLDVRAFLNTSRLADPV